MRNVYIILAILEDITELSSTHYAIYAMIFKHLRGHCYSKNGILSYQCVLTSFDTFTRPN